MKTVTRLVTEDPINKDKKGDPKWVYNDYLSTTFITVNNIQKAASDAMVDDSINAGKVIKTISFDYADSDTPTVIA